MAPLPLLDIQTLSQTQTWLLATLFSLLLLQNRKKEPKNEAPKLPPGPPKLPMHQLGLFPHRTLRDLAQTYGPVMHFQLGHIPTVIISSPSAAEDVMRTHDLSLATRPATVAANSVTYGCTDVAFAPYGPYWRTVREICILELLSSKRVQSFSVIREEEGLSLINSIKSSCNAPVNVTEKLLLYTTM
ncbi:hypothetical protein AMTR_s00028p00116810 [Amborella trichopoda]|uniref:Cytochrome P450 n=1 Tax=Amborella trichopoda TaxID=13333 RepID=W1PRA8_AMBTC|nr:hypothetical protein AMTR_s00028p00116810 [Amborella trichopoda]